MKSYNSGLAVGLQAEERSTENQWSQRFHTTQSFGLKVTALENKRNQNKRNTEIQERDMQRGGGVDRVKRKEILKIYKLQTIKCYLSNVT